MAMNDIYESASLVLVSAHGDSMDFGIHGVSRPRPITQIQEDVGGLRLTNLVREESGSSLALWQTRGWTYQEAVCARRLLHFTITRAYFECQCFTFYEDMYNATTEVDEFSAYGLHGPRTIEVSMLCAAPCELYFTQTIIRIRCI